MVAAEQKARSTYEYLINLASDPDVIEPLTFLREREIVHFQRFGESLRYVQEYLENRKRFSMPKTFGAKSMTEMNKKSMPEPYISDMPGRRIGSVKMGDPESVPTMQRMRNVPFNESRNFPGMPTEQPRTPVMPETPVAPILPGLPINPQIPTAPPEMNMTGGMRGTMPEQAAMPVRNMPGTTPPGMNMPGGMNMRGTMPEQTTMPGKMNMPGTMNMPEMQNMPKMPNMKEMQNMPKMPSMKDMQNMPGTSTMPEMRRIQTPNDISNPPKR